MEIDARHLPEVVNVAPDSRSPYLIVYTVRWPDGHEEEYVFDTEEPGEWEGLDGFAAIWFYRQANNTEG